MKLSHFQFPWSRISEPEPEPPTDWYFSPRTGWHNRIDEQREAGRIAGVEAAARATREMRDGARTDGFSNAGPRIGLQPSANGGFRDVEAEAREAVRVHREEQAAANREEMRHGSTDGFVHGQPDYGKGHV